MPLKQLLCVYDQRGVVNTGQIRLMSSRSQALLPSRATARLPLARLTLEISSLTPPPPVLLPWPCCARAKL